MAYWLDDGFDTWPETIRAGCAAAGLYVRCGAWISRGIGGGAIVDAVVPVEVAAMYGTQEWITKLVAVGLWVDEGSGYRDVKYFAMGNPTAEVVATRKAQAAERQRRFRSNKARPGSGNAPVTRDSRVSSTVSHSSPALPPLKGVGGAGPKGAAGKPHPFNERPDSPNWCVCDMPRANKIHTQGGRAA